MIKEQGGGGGGAFIEKKERPMILKGSGQGRQLMFCQGGEVGGSTRRRVWKGEGYGSNIFFSSC